jgi:hypothetical protein
VGSVEAACLARARDYHEWCENTRQQSVTATFIPTGVSTAFPPGDADVYAQASVKLEIAVVVLTSSVTCKERIPILHKLMSPALEHSDFTVHIIYFGDSGVSVDVPGAVRQRRHAAPWCARS